MSRYVNLDGNTWDGTPISSKIQEVKTRHGYMSGITIGWLYGDNVPHIDLEEHDKEIYNRAVNDLTDKIFKILPDNIETEISSGAFAIELSSIAESMKQSVGIPEQLEKTAEKICDEFCIYRCTCDENAECNYIRCGNTCPLDALL